MDSISGIELYKVFIGLNYDENFETINGPDLFIYLSKDLTNKDFVNLGEIKATKGNVNYEVNSSIDTTQYKNVLVWCRAFGVLFSYAELK